MWYERIRGRLRANPPRWKPLVSQKHDRAGAAGERAAVGRVDRRLELVLRRVDLLVLPRPERAVPAAGGAAEDVLEGPRLLVDLVEVREDLDDVVLPPVAVPALRGAAGGLGVGHRVPVVDVVEPHRLAAVRVDDRRGAPVDAPMLTQGLSRPNVGRSSPFFTAVPAYEEGLAEGGDAVVVAHRRQQRLGLGDELRHVGRGLLPALLVGEELGERDDRDPVAAVAARPRAPGRGSAQAGAAYATARLDPSEAGTRRAKTSGQASTNIART